MSPSAPKARAVEELRSHDGKRLALHVFEGRRGAPRVLVVPGFWRSGLSPGMRGLAAHLSRRYRPFLFDLRGHGRSGGAFTFGREEWRDLTLVLERLHEQETSPLAIVGFSMGGTVAITALGRGRERFPAIASLATVAAPVDPGALRPRWWRPWICLQLRPTEVWRVPRFVPPNWVRERPDPRESAPLVSPVPLLVVHGRGDWLVADDDAVALYEAAREPKELRFIEHRLGLHADALLRFGREEFLGTLDAWLEGTFRSCSGMEDLA